MKDRAKRRLATLGMIIACAAMLHAGPGCEDAQRQADKKVAEAIAKSQQAAMKEGGAAEAKRLLEAAAAEEGASDATKASAKSLLAQTNYAEAVKRLGELSAREAKVTELIGNIERLAQQIAANNLLIAQCKGSNPAGITPDEPLKALAASKAKCTAMAADLAKRIAAVESQIRAKNADITALGSNRTTAAAKVDSAKEKAQEAKGEASLALFKEAAAARAQADNLTYAVGQEKDKLAGLQQSLAELKEQMKIALEGVAAADRQTAELTKAWGQAQAVMSRLAADSKSIAGDTFNRAGDAKLKAAGVAATAKELAAAAASADQIRQEVDALLLKAYEMHKAAHAAAGAVNAAMSQRRGKNSQSLEQEVGQKMERLHSFEAYQLAESRVMITRGDLCAAHKSVLQSERRAFQVASAALRQAGLAVPAELNEAAITRQLQAADKAARGYYAAADDLLKDNIERGQADEKPQAYYSRIAAQYALYAMTGAQANLTTARDMLKEAIGAEGEDSSAPAKVMGPLPSDLEKDIVKRVAVIVSPGPVKPKPGQGPGPAGTGQEAKTWLKMLQRAAWGLARPGDGGQPEK